jgi:CHAT domain-containing protein
LKDAVKIYMTPLYFDDQALGLSSDVRDLVVETYMDAIFQTNGEDPMQALGPAEWVRNSTVQSALADAAIRSVAKDPALSELVRKDQDLRNEIRTLKIKAAVEMDSSVSTHMSELNILRAEIQAQIKAKFPEYNQLVAAAPPSIDAAAKALAADEVLALLLPTEKSVFVWTLAGDGKNAAVHVDLSNVELTKLVKDLRKSLDFGEMDSRVGKFNNAAAFNIYRQLLAPVQASLNGKKHLIVAAGGVLGQIPFGVLLSDPPTSLGTDEPFLIKQLAISHVPSLSAWLAVKKFAESKRAPETLIAWGDPSFAVVNQEQTNVIAKVRRVSLTRSYAHDDSESLTAKGGLRYSDIPALPETRDELMAIAGALKENPQVALHLGTQATKASVLQSNENGELARKKVVVFATHGLMAGDLPNLTQPALALAYTGKAAQDPLDPLLMLEDVLSMKLNADWVVLSACNTAAADGKVEEAMSGLARGFFYAGSRSLLVTHWAVETESAKLLTTNTFLNYSANPNARKAESLRQAMLTVMAIPAYAHPAYWAPYALVGDGGR